MQKQEKGEIMKSIELSEEEIRHLTSLVDTHIRIFEDCAHKPDISLRAKEALQNAKPIEPIEKWSLNEIVKSWNKQGFDDAFLKHFLEDLINPPPMRDRTFKEKLIWLSEQEECEKYQFSVGTQILSESKSINANSSFYRINRDSQFIPIPQIEKEK